MEDYEDATQSTNTTQADDDASDGTGLIIAEFVTPVHKKSFSIKLVQTILKLAQLNRKRSDVIVIITLFSILERVTGPPIQASCCCRSRVFPVDLLDDGKFRFGYVAAFGSTSSMILNIFLSQDSITEAFPGWSKTLILLLFVLALGVAFYPLFCCLSTSWVFLGSVIGFIYAGAWFYLGIRQLIQTPDKTVAIITGFPQQVCSVALIVVYVYRCVDHALTVRRTPNVKLLAKEERRKCATEYNHAYVRRLFRNNEKELEEEGNEPTTRLAELLRFLSKWVYQNDPTFRYSTRILCVMTVAIICAYQLGTTFVIFAARSIKQIGLLENLAQSIPMTNGTSPLAGLLVEFIVYIKLGVDVLSVSAIMSFLIASLFTLYSMARIMANYRHNLCEMYKGSYRHLPFNREDREANIIMSDSLAFAGSQVAYILWGYLVVFVVFLVIGALTAFMVILPLTGDVPNYFLLPVINVIIPVLILQLQKYIKKLISSHVLLESRPTLDKKGKETKKSLLALKNRPCFHNVSFFLFFFYVILGIFSCFSTIIKSVVLGVFYLARLDRCSLCQGFETWDRGYMIYLSFLYVEASHRHPVVLVFCDLLCDSAVTNDPVQMNSFSNDLVVDEESSTGSRKLDSKEYPSNRKLVRNRWLKAYTLVRNQSLICLIDDCGDGKRDEIGLE